MMHAIKTVKERYLGLSVTMRATLWFFVCSFLQKGISVISTPIFTRLLSTAEYGQYNVFNSWYGIVSVVITFNICWGVYPAGAVKYESDRARFSSSLQGLTLTMVAAAAVVYLVYPPFWNQLFEMTTVQVLAMLVMTWTSAAFNYWAFEQRTLFRYRELIMVTLAVSAAKPLIGILFVSQAQDKVTARILGLVLVELVFYTGLFALQMRRGKCFFSKKYWLYALPLGFTLIPHYLAQTILSGADRIMIKYMVSESAAGIYSLAYSISQVMMIVDNSMNQTLQPWVFQKIKNDRVEDIAKPMYFSLIVMAVVNLLLISFSPEIVMLFAPKEYYAAIYAMPPIIMSVYFMYAYNLFSKFEFYFEKTKYIAAATMLAAVLNIVLNAIFIPRFGYYAAGYTTLVCYMSYTLFHYLFTKKLFRDLLPGRKIYDVRVLVMITGVFLLLGFLLTASFSNRLLRYIEIGIGMMAALVLRRKILDIVRQFLQIKRSANK